MAKEKAKKRVTKPKKKYVYKIYDPTVDQAVVGVTIHHWVSTSRNTITVSENEKTTTFFTSGAVAKVYENLLANQYEVARLKADYRRLRKNVEKREELLGKRSVPYLTQISDEDRMKGIAENLENIRLTAERGKLWKLQVGQINFDSANVMSEQEREEAREKIITDIKADVKKRIIKSEFENTVDGAVTYDFVKSTRYNKKADKAGVYLVLGGVHSYSSVFSQVKDAGINIKNLSYNSYRPVIYLKDVADINLLQLVTSEIKIEKQHLVSDLAKQYNTLSEKVERDIKKYCGF